MNLETLEAPHSVGSLESSHTDGSVTDARYCLHFLARLIHSALHQIVHDIMKDA